MVWDTEKKQGFSLLMLMRIWKLISSHGNVILKVMSQTILLFNIAEYIFSYLWKFYAYLSTYLHTLKYAIKYSSDFIIKVFLFAIEL